MLKKAIVSTSFLFVTFLFSSCNSFAQEDSEKLLINNFIIDLFEESISPEEVVEKYLIFSKKENAGGVIGYNVAVKQIEYIRLKKPNNKNWLMPNSKISDLKKRNIASYNEYKTLDKESFFTSVNDSFKKEIYVLLDEDKKEILQFFQIKNQKIKGFTLFVKTDDASFFTYD